MATKKNIDAVETVQQETFDGYTIIQSERYAKYKDILSILLNDGELYSHSQIDEILNQELNREIIEEVN